MKYVLLSIFVLFAAQPLQAVPCDMCDGQDKTGNQHQSMPDHAMPDHSGHGSAMLDGMQDKDCCDGDTDDAGHSCGAMSHCGACSTGLTAVTPSAVIALLSPGSVQVIASGDASLSHFSSPPFRPPIC